MTIMKEWLSTFGKILIKPVPQTFSSEAQKAKGKFPSAVFWLVIVIGFPLIINFVTEGATESFGAVIFVLIMFPIIFLFYVFCVHLLYLRLFHRKKNYYDELLYIMVSIFALVWIFASIVTIVPTVGEFLSWGIFLYGLVLLIIAVKTITKLQLWQTIVTVVLGTLLALGGLLCIPAFIMSLIGTVPRIF